MATTTISLSEERKAEFDEARPEDANSADEFVGMLLACWQGENELQREQTIDVEDARILSQHLEKAIAPYFEEMNQTVELEATTVKDIARQVAEELR